jgi:hypothetical protein
VDAGRARKAANAVADTGVDGKIHKRHVVPREISKKLKKHGMEHMDEFDYVAPLPEAFHRAIHSGKGYGRGGRYNHWWRAQVELARQDSHTVIDDAWIRDRADEAAREFGFPVPF